MIPYPKLVRRLKGLAWEEFRRRVKFPHLIMETALEKHETARFSTERMTEDQVRAAMLGQEAMAIPVRKRTGGNAFPNMITVGRAPNNDVVIPDKSVSSFHAYLRFDGEGWYICDASSNGTYVDGAMIPKEEEVPLPSGAQIGLAKLVQLLFLEPAGLYQRVKRGH